MSDCVLSYGRETITCTLPTATTSVLEPDWPERALGHDELAGAFNRPVDSHPLRKLARAANTALIILSDATRVTRADVVLPLVLKELQRGGMERSCITVIIACGNHRLATESEIVTILGADLAEQLHVVQHDSSDQASLRQLPPTSRGTRPGLNRLLWENDLVISLSTVTAHYFAGFGGGRKNIFPGLGGRDGIIANHRLSIDFQSGKLAKGVEAGRTVGNPVAEDIEEIVSHRPPDFSIVSLLSPERSIAGLWCGHWKSGHAQACSAWMHHHGVKITEKRPWVVASCGGAPKDIDLVQAHKSFDYAVRALQPGGRLLLVAECPDSQPNERFGSFFPISDVGGLLDRLKQDSVANGQTALAWLNKVQRYQVALYSSVSAELVRRMGCSPVENRGGLETWLQDTQGPGYIIPHASMTLPTLNSY